MVEVEAVGDLFEQVMRDRIHKFRDTLRSFDTDHEVARLSQHLPAKVVCKLLR